VTADKAITNIDLPLHTHFFCSRSFSSRSFFLFSCKMAWGNRMHRRAALALQHRSDSAAGPLPAQDVQPGTQGSANGGPNGECIIFPAFI
jgi:hypothetical protein